MKPLEPIERAILDRACRGETWIASDDEWSAVKILAKAGFLREVDLGGGLSWYPNTPAGERALRIDNAFRRSQ